MPSAEEIGVLVVIVIALAILVWANNRKPKGPRAA